MSSTVRMESTARRSLFAKRTKHAHKSKNATKKQVTALNKKSVKPKELKSCKMPQLWPSLTALLTLQVHLLQSRQSLRKRLLKHPRDWPNFDSI